MELGLNKLLVIKFYFRTTLINNRVVCKCVAVTIALLESFYGPCFEHSSNIIIIGKPAFQHG